MFLHTMTAFLDDVPASSGGGGGIGGIITMVVQLAILVATLGGFYKIFVKAGQPGWAIIVPIYGQMTLAKVAGKPAWQGILLLVPGVGAIMAFIILIGIAKKFGKGAGFGIGMWFLPMIFCPMLGFGDAQYNANG
jgi:hypothetical protein